MALVLAISSLLRMLYCSSEYNIGYNTGSRPFCPIALFTMPQHVIPFPRLAYNVVSCLSRVIPEYIGDV